MIISEEQVKAYIDSGLQRCPSCGKRGRINSAPDDCQDWLRVRYIASCGHCDAEWTEQYKIETIYGDDS